jgi:hypothetical protein
MPMRPCDRRTIARTCRARSARVTRTAVRSYRRSPIAYDIDCGFRAKRRRAPAPSPRRCRRLASRTRSWPAGVRAAPGGATVAAFAWDDHPLGQQPEDCGANPRPVYSGPSAKRAPVSETSKIVS